MASGIASPVLVDDDGVDLEWLVKLAGALGMNPIRVRWRLVALARWWAARKRDLAPATSRRFRHQKCWSCRQIRAVDEPRCGHCGARLGSKPAAFMRSLGFVVPPSLAMSSLLVSLNLAIYLRVWMADGTLAFGLSHESLLVFGAHGSHGLADPVGWWRLLASMFLHFNLLHLGLNMMALLQVGPSVEDLLGRGEMLSAFLLSGIAGNLLSELRTTPFIGAGASGAILGLVGLAAGVGHASRSVEGRTVRNRMLQWGAYTLLFGVAMGADNLAHLGGFVAGGVWGLARATRVVFRGQPRSHPALGLMGGLLLGASTLPPLLRPVDPRQRARAPAAAYDEEVEERSLGPVDVVASAAPAQGPRSLDSDLPVVGPQASSIEELLGELERAGGVDPRGSFTRWGRGLAHRLKQRQVVSIPGLRGGYRIVARSMPNGAVWFEVEATTALAPPPGDGAADEVPRALRSLLARGDVVLPPVGSFVVRPCLEGEASPCASFVLGGELEAYGLGESDDAKLAAVLGASAPSNAASSGVRGVALVEIVIEHVEAYGLVAMPSPMGASELASLTFPGGRPLPPSLRRWLRFDRTVPFGDQPPRALRARAYWKAELRYDDPGWLRRLDAVIPREVVPLPGGDESRTALYLGAMDERGEYPLLVFDIDDVPSVYFEAGFDVWLARHFSLPGFDPPELPARVAQEAFGGRTSLTAW
jgi:membrane associated rhomboid family serine protease